MRLSLCTIALNERDLIQPMLDSVKDVVDEIIVGIDDRTIDDTASIVVSNNGRAPGFTWEDDFATARNQVMRYATGDWILALDADERLTGEGAAMINDVMGKLSRGLLGGASGFRFLLANTDLEGNVHTVVQTPARLFRRSPEIQYRGVVHEEVWDFAGEPYWYFLAGPVAISHVGYDPRLWVGRMKHARNVRLLEKRLALDTNDDYARRKLSEEMALDASGFER